MLGLYILTYTPLVVQAFVTHVVRLVVHTRMPPIQPKEWLMTNCTHVGEAIRVAALALTYFKLSRKLVDRDGVHLEVMAGGGGGGGEASDFPCCLADVEGAGELSPDAGPGPHHRCLQVFTKGHTLTLTVPSPA